MALKAKLYEHFTPKEMAALGAFCFGYQVVHKVKKMNEPGYEELEIVNMPAHQIEKITQSKRLWTPWERLMASIRFFSEKKVPFVMARYDGPNNRVESDSVQTGRALEQSKIIYDAIIAWDEKLLQEYMDGDGGLFCEQILKLEEKAPVALTENDFVSVETAIEDFKAGQAEKKDGEPVVPAKRRGRPPAEKKDKVEA